MLSYLVDIRGYATYFNFRNNSSKFIVLTLTLSTYIVNYTTFGVQRFTC